MKRVGLLGSLVRGELRDDNDIDILVKIDQDISLLDFVGIKLEQDAVLRRLEIMGEAVKNIPQEYRKKYPNPAKPEPKRDLTKNLTQRIETIQLIQNNVIRWVVSISWKNVFF